MPESPERAGFASIHAMAGMPARRAPVTPYVTQRGQKVSRSNQLSEK